VKFFWKKLRNQFLNSFPRVEVRMGSANRANLRPLPINQAAITPHPNFVPATRANDIAVIRLITAILPNAEIAPIALPPIVTPALVLPFENEEGFFTGFGVSVQGGQPSSFLHRGYQRVTGNVRCTQFFIVDVNQGFCGEDLAERSSACDGDVGNPYVVSYRRQETLVGLVKMHPACNLHLKFVSKSDFHKNFFLFQVVKCLQQHTPESHTTEIGFNNKCKLKKIHLYSKNKSLIKRNVFEIKIFCYLKFEFFLLSYRVAMFFVDNKLKCFTQIHLKDFLILARL
jgi:Trypsin